METPDPPNGDGESRSYLVHVEMHAECPIVLQAESVDDAVDEAMRMAAEGYFNDRTRPSAASRRGLIWTTPVARFACRRGLRSRCFRRTSRLGPR